jgi:hypothetical protein
VFDVGEQGILLGAVEAMDLVEEQHRSPARPGLVRRLLDDRAHLLDAGDDRGERDEPHPRRIAGEQLCERRLSAARRSPQQQGRQGSALDEHAERCARADELAVPDHLLEAARSHPIRQRCGRRRSSLRRGGFRAPGVRRRREQRERIGVARRHPRSVAVALRQLRLDALPPRQPRRPANPERSA